MFEYLDANEQERLKALRLKDAFADETLLQVDRILGSRTFERVGQKVKDFVGFVVSKKLLGEADQIKEMTIAMAAYKDQGYDPAVNNKIRVAAIDLRKRLRGYAESEGAQDPIKILMPEGAYIPEIEERHRTIALASFENWNPDSDQDYLCRAVNEEIAHRLKHAGTVRINRVPRPEEGEARYGLRGSLEIRDGHLRVNVSLSDREIRCVIFSQAFEEQRDDILK